MARVNTAHILSLRRKMDQRGCGEARVAAILNALRSFLKFCRDVLRLAVLDPRHIRVPRMPRRDVEYLTKEEVDQYVRAIIGPGCEGCLGHAARASPARISHGRAKVGECVTIPG